MGTFLISQQKGTGLNRVRRVPICQEIRNVPNFI